MTEKLSKRNMGRLKKVDLRSIWESESVDFTPWLSNEKNLQLLGETLGLELELEATEQQVGPFRADILCKNTLNGDWVLIENQLERTDHTHLGQLLTYAAGLDAVIIVWVASKFTDDHRAALDWLNDITDSRFNFFGIEVELWRIGESATAPKFNLISKPNEWKREVFAGTAGLRNVDLTEGQKLQLKFWQAYKVYSDSQETLYRATKGLPQHWMSIAIGRSGFSLTAILTLQGGKRKASLSHEIRAEFEIHTGDDNDKYFEILKAQQDYIHNELGYDLTWHAPEKYRVRRMYVRKAVNAKDETDWPNQHAWLTERLSDLYRVFKPLVMSLDN